MQFTGKTVEEAIETGLKELNIENENAEITVIQEPVKGLFGKIKVLAKVGNTVITQADVDSTIAALGPRGAAYKSYPRISAQTPPPCKFRQA